MVTVTDARRFPAEPGGSNLLAAPIGPESALRTVGPFAIVGHHRTAPAAPGAMAVDRDVRPHPHIGLSAVSYVLDGSITHRDGLGNRSELGPGSAGFLISGRGLVHSERFERLRLLGGSLDMFQVLVALPDGGEDVEPMYLYVAPEQIPTARADGYLVRWLAHPSPAIGAPLPFPSPTLLADVTLGADAGWPVPAADERAIYVWEGAVEVEGTRVGAGQVGVLAPGPQVLRAAERSRLLVFGGAPVGSRYLWWNYLHSSLDRIEAAKAEWREGRATLPTGDTESFTPAPADGGRPLRRLNAGGPDQVTGRTPE
jgi:redox-sensitive bicupin YhaK (pirin superfamily)